MSQYPLEQIATIKQRRLEEAEKLLKERRKTLETEQTKLDSLQKEFEVAMKHRQDKLTQMREEMDGGTTTDKIEQMRHYLKVVEEEVKVKRKKRDQQKEITDKAAAAVEEARLDVFKKQKEVEKLALHRKEWEKEERVKEVYIEGQETDEIGSSRHLLKKRQQKKDGGSG